MNYNIKQARLFWGAIFAFVLVLTFLNPYQIINSDSVTGFEALKGGNISGKWNTIVQPASADIASFDHEFLSWWTPGQYLVPNFIQSVFHLSLGHSIILINILSVLLGLLGFYKIFKHYNFSLQVNLLSLLLIISSNTVLYRFISYQGGENLSFLFFPWALYFFITLKNKILRTFLIAPVLIIAFIAKSQMLLALTPLFFLVPFAGYINQVYFSKQPVKAKSVLAELSGILLVVAMTGMLIYKFYISRGINPSDTEPFHPSAMGIVAPLAAPLMVIGNLSEIVQKLSANHYAVAIIFLSICFLIIAFIFRKNLKSEYTVLVLTYYACFSAIFIYLFFFTKIDHNARHFKFVGYLFFPILLAYVLKLISPRILKVAIAAVVLFSIANHYRLSKIWFNETYLSQGDFRLDKKEFPEDLYRYLNKEHRTVLFFSPFESRWAIDTQNIICINNTGNKIYNGHGLPVIYVEKAGSGPENMLKQRFPSYRIHSSHTIGDHIVIELR